MSEYVTQSQSQTHNQAQTQGLARVQSRALLGLDAPSVTVEVHLANGIPSFTLVGLAETEVKEARERVRSALQNSGFEFPHNKRITVNLAPADLPKDSGRFDLPIALGILAASGQISGAWLAAYEFAGELSLSGELRSVRGALAMSLALYKQGQAAHGAVASAAAAAAVASASASASTAPVAVAEGAKSASAALPKRVLPKLALPKLVLPKLVLPEACAHEAALIEHIEVYAATHLLQVIASLADQAHPDAASAEVSTWRRVDSAHIKAEIAAAQTDALLDLADVKGQSLPKRALEIAAAGGHSVLMLGPPGSGKSMLAQRFGGLLPPMSTDEALQSAALASLAGRFKLAQWARRPTSAPHHTASAVALVGGGSPPRPGEISLAHGGVLFLDELPEFARAALEALREPLESGTITISRAAQRSEFPAQFQLIAAMNPCPCGYLGARIAGKSCRCTPDQVLRYQGKISGPLLDRIDLHLEVAAMPSAELLGAGFKAAGKVEEKAGEQVGEQLREKAATQGKTDASDPNSSAAVRGRVVQARQIAQARQGCANQQLSPAALQYHAPLGAAQVQFLSAASERLGFSARSTHRILRVARTIADLAGSADIQTPHLAEALQYRRALKGG